MHFSPIVAFCRFTTASIRRCAKTHRT
jgi:hypothetical protein